MPSLKHLAPSSVPPGRQTICIHADLRSTRGHSRQETSHRSSSSSSASRAAAGPNAQFSGRRSRAAASRPSSSSSSSALMTMARRNRRREAIVQWTDRWDGMEWNVLVRTQVDGDGSARSCPSISSRSKRLHIVVAYE
jgi:hypothetical protein